jgi:outer membrane protein assembly factor BamB
MVRNRNLLSSYIALFVIFSSIIILGVYAGSNGHSWNYFIIQNPGETASVCDMSDDGKYMVLGCENDYLYLFEKSNSNPIWQFKAQEYLIQVDISSDGHHILATGDGGKVYRFARESFRPILNYTTDSFGLSMQDVAISSDGSYLATTSRRILYLFHGNDTNPLWINTDAGERVLISSDGNIIATLENAEGIIRLFHKSSSIPIWQYYVGNFLYDLAITPDGNFIVTGGQFYDWHSGYTIYLFNASSSTPRVMYTEGIVRGVAISHDGAYIAASCSDGVYLFNATTLTRIWKYELPSDSDSTQIAISSDGSFIVTNFIRYISNEEDTKLLFFNKLNNTPIWTKSIEYVNDVEISADGKDIAVSTASRFYYINSDNPEIDAIYEFLDIRVLLILCISIAIGIIIAPAYFNNQNKVKLILQKKEY